MQNHCVLALIKIDGFIKLHDKAIYEVTFDYEWFDKVWDRIKYLINKKVVIQIAFIIILEKSVPIFPIEKILTCDNVIILLKSVITQNKKECYYNIFLEKGLYKDKSNTEYF